jgi:hypothetical protein
MQRPNSIQNATINAFAGIQLGLANVVANAAARTTTMRGKSAMKGSDPGKSGGPSSRSWRCEEPSYRHDHEHVVSVPRVGTTVAGCTPTPSNLPPTLWAAWVLSRSLCG